MTGRWTDEERDWEWRRREDAFRRRDDGDFRTHEEMQRSFSPATGGYGPAEARRGPDRPVFGEYETGIDYSTYRQTGADQGRYSDEARGVYSRSGPGRVGYPGGREGLYREVYGYGPRDDLSRQAWEGRAGRRDERRLHDREDRHIRDQEGRYDWRDAPRRFFDRAAERMSAWFEGEDDGRRGTDEHRGGVYRGRGPQAYQRPDERIADEVHERLTEDAWVDASNISVSVSGGEVTLSGTVPEREQKHRAERLIEDLSGVGHVQNNLRVARGNFLTSPTRGFGDSAQQAQMSEGDSTATPMGRRADS